MGDITGKPEDRIENDSSVYTPENMALVADIVVYSFGKAVGANTGILNRIINMHADL